MVAEVGKGGECTISHRVNITQSRERNRGVGWSAESINQNSAIASVRLEC